MATDELPDEATMLEMVNVDIFPFYDDYNPETYRFDSSYQAEQVISVTRTDVTFLLNTQEQVSIPVEYLKQY